MRCTIFTSLCCAVSDERSLSVDMCFTVLEARKQCIHTKWGGRGQGECIMCVNNRLLTMKEARNGVDFIAIRMTHSHKSCTTT